MNSVESFLLNAPVMGVLAFVFAAVISALICYGITRALMRSCIAFNGLVMYVIFSIANPFTGAMAIDSNILENLLATMSSAAGN